MLSRARCVSRFVARPFFSALSTCSIESTGTIGDKADVVIIGGGVVGSSAAYFLSKEDPNLKVTLLERDLTYKYCATTRSAASIRHQFSTKENVQISQFGTEFLRNIDNHLRIPGCDERIDPQFKENGYLFLASATGESILRNNINLQKECGADISLLDTNNIKDRFPWMSTEGLMYGGFGESGEGWFDPAILMNSFRNKAKCQGVTVVQGEAVDIKLDSSGTRVNSVLYKDSAGATNEIHCGNCINASGANSARKFASMIGADIPVYAKKRCIFVFDCEQHEVANCPLVVDPSGMYFRSEGKYFISGICYPESNDPTVEREDVEPDYDLFEEIIWPLLATRVPAFEAIKVVNAWAGHYDHNLFDYNAIVGPDTNVSNFFYANGFSGHGLQQAPAVGRALSELIIHNQFVSIDLSKFSVGRIAANQPIEELNVV
uniref:FAD-dependent oxidoreductase domain-containing protein 1 n=1 Tax=Vannella robusta TaxID=1487602 RepID=A0A7S4MHQ2_9EUKA|mmetsp:Transcript_22441/g.28664  ORF Transcript_22441/g.28664 Transcript_22441/m.28664 type:complete len:434 (+) Transcript_22441:36-1337(+)